MLDAGAMALERERGTVVDDGATPDDLESLAHAVFLAMLNEVSDQLTPGSLIEPSPPGHTRIILHVPDNVLERIDRYRRPPETRQHAFLRLLAERGNI